MTLKAGTREGIEAAPAPLAPQFKSQTFALLKRIFREGFSVLGRDREAVRTADANHWLHEPGLPPSYSASGRLRFTLTLRDALALSPQKVLEVAAGGGLLSACLAEPGRRMVVNDLRDMSQDIAQWRTGTPLEFLQGNLLELDPARVGSFDLVMACDVIEHVAHGDKFLSQLRRFLTPGGQLLLTTPNGGYFRNRLPTHSQIRDFTELEAKQFKPDADGHIFLYTKAELEKVARAAGFEPVSWYYSVTPWISGQAGLRRLPRFAFLIPAYLWLERMFSKWPLASLSSAQMTLLARAV